MASKSKPKKVRGVRTPASLSGERGGARNRIRPIEPVGGGTIGGLLTPSAQGQTGI